MKKFLLVAISLFVASASFAQPLKFMASEDISYDDNIYLTDGNEKGSAISTTRVGVDYKAQIPGSSLNLGANAVVGYNAYSEDNSKNGYWDVLGNVALSNNIFKFGDTFLYTSDPANLALTERAKRINNIAYVSAKTSSEKMFGFGVTLDDVYDRYTESQYNDLNRNRINAGVQAFYNLSPKTNVFAEYVYSDIAYSDNKDNDSTGSSLGLGISGTIASKITGTAKLTYDMRDYDHNPAGFDKNNELVGYLVSLQWMPTTQNIIRLSGARKMEETIYGNNRFFTSTSVSLYASQKMYEKITASVTVAYENLSYDKEVSNVKRSDDVITLRPAVDYAFKNWLTAGVWYQYRDRASNANNADYANNKVGAFVKALF